MNLATVIFGVRADSLDEARAVIEPVIGGEYELRDSLSCGGTYLDIELDSFSLWVRLNHFDDGLGYRWVWENPDYRYVFETTSPNPVIEDLIRKFAQHPRVSLYQFRK